MTELENFLLVERKVVKKEVVYKNPDELEGERWVPLFCYDSALPAQSYLQKHKHTAMKEAFCVERGRLTVIDESPEGDVVESQLSEGDFYLVEEDHWHTIVNKDGEEVGFLAMGIVQKVGGETIDSK